MISAEQLLPCLGGRGCPKQRALMVPVCEGTKGSAPEPVEAAASDRPTGEEPASPPGQEPRPCFAAYLKDEV